MRRCVLTILWILFLPAAVRAENEFMVLCLHDVIDTRPGQRAEQNSTANLAAYLRWLHENRYNPISIDDVLAARDGIRPLPPRAVMLTFDDGYESFYSRVFPLLKAYGYPALFALVGKWMAVPPGGSVPYGDALWPRERFMTWDQVREVVASGLIEIASHSFDMHHGIIGNRQGNNQPALTTRLYQPKTGSYEKEETYIARVRADLKAASDLIQRETGKRPRVMVWPYGAYNGKVVGLANELGMPFTMTLEEGLNRATGDLSRIKRFLLSQDPTLDEFVSTMRSPVPDTRLRTVRVSLDDVYDSDPAQQQRNIDALVSRIYQYGVTHVILKAYSDPAGEGIAREVYFPNRHLPMRADLFSYVAWQLETRANAPVYAWLPVLGFDFGGSAVPNRTRNGERNAAITGDVASRSRTSPFDRDAVRRVRQIYEDLAAYTHFDGLAFVEDTSAIGIEHAEPAVIAGMADRLGLPISVEAVRSAPAAREHWNAVKDRAFVELTGRILRDVTAYRAPVATMRSIVIPRNLATGTVERLEQILDRVLAAYDVAAMLVPPSTGGASDASWLHDLARLIRRHPEGLRHTLVELPAVRFDNGRRPIDSSILREHMRLLVELGVRSFGYFPDDFRGDHPKSGVIHGALSAMIYPYVR